MFERFTERARKVVVLAQDEARVLKHGYIGAEHLLLGLLREEEGLAARVLESLGVRVDESRDWIRRTIGEGNEEVTTGQIPFTRRARKILELALREALSLGHNYVGTEHLLLASAREEQSEAMVYLNERGVTAETIRNEIIRLLSGTRQRTTRQWSRRDVTLGDFFTRDDYVYKVVGICDDPTVVLQELTSEHQTSYVIGSPLFGDFTKLEPREAP